MYPAATGDRVGTNFSGLNDSQGIFRRDSLNNPARSFKILKCRALLSLHRVLSTHQLRFEDCNSTSEAASSKVSGLTRWSNHFALRVEKAGERVWVGGGELAGIIFADVGGCAPVETGQALEKREPLGYAALPFTTVGEDKDFIRNEPLMDQPQERAGVGGGRFAGNDNLFRLRQTEIERRDHLRHGFGNGFQAAREDGDSSIGLLAKILARGHLGEPKQIRRRH